MASLDSAIIFDEWANWDNDEAIRMSLERIQNGMFSVYPVWSKKEDDESTSLSNQLNEYLGVDV